MDTRCIGLVKKKYSRSPSSPWMTVIRFRSTLLGRAVCDYRQCREANLAEFSRIEHKESQQFFDRLQIRVLQPLVEGAVLAQPLQPPHLVVQRRWVMLLVHCTRAHRGLVRQTLDMPRLMPRSTRPKGIWLSIVYNVRHSCCNEFRFGE